MPTLQICDSCEAKITDENATFCKKCGAVVRGANSRWMIPE